MQQPVPFEIATSDGVQIATNGTTRLAVLPDVGGRVFRRRGVTGLAIKPAAEVLVPQLNALAGELLANPGMAAGDAVARVLAIAGMVPTAEPRRHEWAVADVDGVRVYVNGADVIVTRQDLMP